jgi:GTP cyclohydrolase I
MEPKRILEHVDCLNAVERLAIDSVGLMRIANPNGNRIGMIKAFGVPRGGIPVVYLLTAHGHRIVGSPEFADVIVDDLVDSGRTKDSYTDRYQKPFLALANYLHPQKKKGEWIVFPWEQGAEDTSADDIVIRLLQYIGEDPEREGLKETPQRVLKAWKEWTAGYSQKPEDVLRAFEDGAHKYDEMVWVKGIPFYSTCEHHLAPFFGTVTVSYIPNGKIIGLSKLNRLTSVFARRLQVQERLTVQIADALMDALNAKGVGVLVQARHLCMESRGVSQQGHQTITSALRGAMLEDKVRAEFLAIANK